MVAHDDGFPVYKRIPKRALHGIVTFLAGLLVFCGFEARG
jgi:LPS O-antigen subunit length determinant protein (WzzB/FepE family)